MTFYYEGDHSVQFRANDVTYDSWEDWHLIPKSRPVINPPQERTSFVTVPGRHGKIDLSWALTGGPIYDNRTGNIDFYVDTSKWHGWHTAYMTILSALQGQSVQIRLTDDPSFIYKGLVYVDKWSSDERYSTISFKYDLYPFKHRITYTENNWLWDPFDFENGVIGDSVSGEEVL